MGGLVIRFGKYMHSTQLMTQNPTWHTRSQIYRLYGDPRMLGIRVMDNHSVGIFTIEYSMRTVMWVEGWKDFTKLPSASFSLCDRSSDF